MLSAIARYEEWLKRLDQELPDKDRTKPKRGKHTREQWEAIKSEYNHTCPCCKRREPEIALTKDHVIPRSYRYDYDIERLDDIDNIQPLCEECNRKKGNRIIRYPVPG